MVEGYVQRVPGSDRGLQSKPSRRLFNVPQARSKYNYGYSDFVAHFTHNSTIVAARSIKYLL